MSPQTEIKKVTTHTLQRMKTNGEKISMITAYDYSFARIFDAAGIDGNTRRRLGLQRHGRA